MAGFVNRFADSRESRDSRESFQGSRIVRSEKWQNESSPNFSNFCPEFPPEFCSEFSPNFSRSFRALFPRKRRPETIHQKSPPFFSAEFPGNYKKIIHKIFLVSRQSNELNPLKIWRIALRGLKLANRRFEARIARTL